MELIKYKRHVMGSLIAGIVLLAASAFNPPLQSQNQDNNLKILPKDISHGELGAVMQSFQVALGVGCDACHAKSADRPGKLDFKADHKNKDIALGMMKLTQEINEKYFEAEGDFKDNYLLSEYQVTCNTCHNGHAKPVQRISVPINFEELDQ